MQPVTGTLQESGITRGAEVWCGTLGGVVLSCFCLCDFGIGTVGGLGIFRIFRGLVGCLRFFFVVFFILLFIGRFFVGGVRGRRVVIYVAAARRPGYVAHASANLDGVGGKNGARRALGVVGQCHDGFGVAVPFLKGYGA